MPDKRRALTKGLSPKQADQFIANAMMMQGVGPDDPIDWNAFATAPAEDQPPSDLPTFLARFAPGAAAQTKKKQGGDLLTTLLMLGYQPDGIVQ